MLSRRRAPAFGRHGDGARQDHREGDGRGPHAFGQDLHEEGRRVPDLDGTGSGRHRAPDRGARQFEDHSGDWAVFALANVSDEQIDRLIVAPHFRLAGSGIIWPDLGSQRIATITPSEGFALDRASSPDADVFHLTLNPGAVITFVAELTSPKLPQLYLWSPEAYKDTLNSFTLYRGIVLGIAGLLAVFLTILFVVKGTSMLPATAALAWAVLAYICVDFGFLSKIIAITPGDERMWRAGVEVFLAVGLVVFLFTYLNLNRWHTRLVYVTLAWLFGLCALFGVALYDPPVAAGIARLSFAATALAGIGLIAYLGFRRYDRAIMLVPTWVLILFWLAGAWMTVTGRLSNDIIQPALGGGLVLIVLLMGFTVMQHAFAGGGIQQGLFSDLERQSLALTGAGDIVWDWDVARDRVTTIPDVSIPLGLSPGTFNGPARNWLPKHTCGRPRPVPNGSSTSRSNIARAGSTTSSACARATATITGSTCGPGRCWVRTERRSAASER